MPSNLRFDQKQKKFIQFNEGDLVLYYKAFMDNRHTGKFEPKWKGPFIIHQVLPNEAYKLCTKEGQLLQTPINGNLLKLYHKLLF